MCGCRCCHAGFGCRGLRGGWCGNNWFQNGGFGWPRVEHFGTHLVRVKFPRTKFFRRGIILNFGGAMCRRVSGDGYLECGERQFGCCTVYGGKEFPGVGEALLGVAGGGLGNQGVEKRWYAVDAGAGGGDVVVEAFKCLCYLGVAGEGDFPSEQFIEDDAGGVDVAFRADVAAFDLFGRKVGDGANDLV